MKTYLSILGVTLYRKDIGDYMHRWILKTPFGSLRLHHILRSDSADAWHDHPADLIMLVLGRYREWTPVAYDSECYGACTARNEDRGTPEEGYGPRDFPPLAPRRGIAELYRDCGPFQVNYIPANKLHRLELRFGPVWSIGWMKPLPSEPVWGFVDRGTGRWTESATWVKAHPERERQLL